MILRVVGADRGLNGHLGLMIRGAGCPRKTRPGSARQRNAGHDLVPLDQISSRQRMVVQIRYLVMVLFSSHSSAIGMMCVTLPAVRIERIVTEDGLKKW